MYQPNGDVHAGVFSEGRAHGPGVYVASGGSESTGSWDQNKRVGVFSVVDKTGVLWTEVYGADGKRTSRKKNRHAVPNPAFAEGAVTAEGTPVPATIDVEDDPETPALQCWNCDGFTRARNNHAWACRSHTGRWAEDRTFRGTGPAPGIW